MQCERIEAAAFARIEFEARIENRAQGFAARDIGAVGLGIIETGASELEKVDRRGNREQKREQNTDASGDCEATQSSCLLRMNAHCDVAATL